MTERSTLEGRLRHLLKGRSVASAGAIQIINLESVRDRLGVSSQQLIGKMRAIVQSVIDRLLGPRDVGMWLSDFAYVIVFGEMKVTEAEIRVEAIAAEIVRRLLGEQADVHQTVRAIVVPVEADAEHSTDILDAVARLLGNDDAEASSKPKNSGATGASPKAGKSRSKVDDEPQWQTFHRHDDKQRDDTASPSSGSQGEDPDGSRHWEELDRAADLPADLRFSYQPIWDVRRKVLSTYSCEATFSHGGDLAHRRHGGTVTAFTSQLDLVLVDKLVDDLTRLHHAGRRVLMACVLHVDTLSARRTRTQFVKAYHSLPENMRRDIIFELVGQWEGMPQSRLIDLMACVKPASRAVAARVDLGWSHFDILREAGITWVTVDLAAHSEREAVLLPLMGNFVERTAKAGLKTCAHGLSSNSLAVAALGAGFDLVGGSAIHGPVDTPEHVFRFDVASLFTSLLTNIRLGR